MSCKKCVSNDADDLDHGVDVGVGVGYSINFGTMDRDNHVAKNFKVVWFPAKMEAQTAGLAHRLAFNFKTDLPRFRTPSFPKFRS